MKNFAITVAGVFVALLLFFVGIPIVIVTMVASSAQPSGTPARAVLSLDLRQGLPDQDPSSALAMLRQRGNSVMSIIQTLRRAEADSRVKAVFVRLPESGVAPAAADELRLAFKHFRASGKPIIVHSQGLYPAGVVVSTYMLGASADQLWMQPGASFQATGMASEDLFFKRFFDHYGVKPNYEQRYEYKTAVNGYLYDDYTPAHREEELGWMTSIYETAVTAAAQDRKVQPAALRKTIEAGPYTADQAKAVGLIDKLGQVKEAEDAALALAGKGAKVMKFEDYASTAVRAEQAGAGPTIAVVGGEGAISTGPGGGGGLMGSSAAISSDETSKAIYDAIEDKSVKAIVFRVSSPGGSDTASEQILAAVRAAKAAGKPVVVSMGTYAASGGYWISSEASAIISEPTTLTGSIGVFGGKFALGDALAKFGVDVRQLGVGGDFSSAYAMSSSFTPTQKAAFAKMIDQVYDEFIARVSIGRHIPPQRVREIAKGRVWTGIQAKQLGLVDQIGGFYDAVDKAKALAGITGKDVRLKMFPAQKTLFEGLKSALGVSESSARVIGTAAYLLDQPQAQALTRQLVQSKMRADGATVLADQPVN
jgi:protease-4